MAEGQTDTAGRIRTSILPSPFVAGGFATLSLFLFAGCTGENLISRIGNFWQYGICSAIIVILDVVALVEVHGSDRTRGNKILWTLIIIFAPILGCIAYYFFGRK